jgi:hypothetical protein
VVRAQGSLPDLDGLHIDLDQASWRLENPPPPKGVGEIIPEFTARSFSLKGQPIRMEEACLKVGLRAQEVTFGFQASEQGRPLLVLAGGEGEVRVSVSKQDIERLLLTGAKRAAQKQGVTVEETGLELVQETDRSARVAVHIRAGRKVLLSKVTATLDIGGQLAIDEGLNVTISGLSCKGTGPLSTVLSAIVQQQLRRFEGRQISLTGFSLGAARLHDLKVEAGASLEVEARFGSS